MIDKISYSGVTYYYADEQTADEAWYRAMTTEDKYHILAQTAILVTSGVGILKSRWAIDDILEAACEKFSKGDLQ